MATTGVSSTSTTSASDAAAAASKAAVKQNIIKTLGAGSGIDTSALAQSLVDAERIPAEDAINTKITKSEAKISGYAAIRYSANELKNAFSGLNDVSDFNSLAVRNRTPQPLVSQPVRLLLWVIIRLMSGLWHDHSEQCRMVLLRLVQRSLLVISY